MLIHAYLSKVMLNPVAIYQEARILKILKPLSVTDPRERRACPPPPPPPPLYFDQTDFFGDRAALFSKGLGDLPPLSQGLDPALHLAKAHFKCFKMMICLLLPLIIHYSRPAQNQLSCY